jgi:alpha-glucuronidase
MAGRTPILTIVGIMFLLSLGAETRAEDGYRLWLRYDRLPERVIEQYRPRLTSVVVTGRSPTCSAIREELVAGLTGLFGQPVPEGESPDLDGSVVVGTLENSPLIASLAWNDRLEALGPDGYRIRSLWLDGRRLTVVASKTDVGALHGAFHFLRLVQCCRPVDDLDLEERPRLQLRVLDHWDNLDGSIERGYAGRSLWDWKALPDSTSDRLRDYARANASVGINGSVLNNVNARSEILGAEYLPKVAAIANVFRPYGVKVYLSARFSAPIELGGLKTADPLDPSVAAWWSSKADEIYQAIPDFGGFLVKASSEGQPGPHTYHRTHADGANMLAAALAPHGGVVMWRAFVYDPDPGSDRAAAAYDSLQQFDGQFAPNVLLQVKNGPIDFQPREPFHPLFGAMPKTSLMLEVQITQEYLGSANYLVFLAPMWRECLDSDTHAHGPGSTVAHILDGSLTGRRLTGMAGVANTGSDRNWTGHHFAQANWYAFGRLAWNLNLRPEQIADEWAALTFTHDRQAASAISQLLLSSYEGAVDSMTPLGLHHIMWPGHHYGPAPWWANDVRPDWNAIYYHRADARGVGFDRTATGSNSVSRYQPAVRDLFANAETCPERYLLWFHHLGWDYRLKSGRALWDELALHYQAGVDAIRRMRRQWGDLADSIDSQRHAEVAKKLAIQEHDAVWWRDAVLLYFQTFSQRALPEGVEPAAQTLDEYMAKSLLDRHRADGDRPR